MTTVHIVSHYMRAAMVRCFASLRSALVFAALAPLAACVTDPAKVEELVKGMEVQAQAAAQERAQQDLNCGAVTTKVLSSQHGDFGEAYDLQRTVFQIEATGCGLRTTYSVACAKKGVCSALSADGIIERVKQP